VSVRTNGRLQATAVAAGALLAGLAVLALGLLLAGYDAGAALAALWDGAFGSWYALTSATLVRAVPLILVGLAITVAFRAGALNIGGEGQFYAGAIAATWVGLNVAALPGLVAVPLVWAAGLAAGALWVAVPVWLRLRYGVLEVISTLLLNFVAEALVSLVVQ
jgi:general nucleoside transport system permease protein